MLMQKWTTNQAKFNWKPIVMTFKDRALDLPVRFNKIRSHECLQNCQSPRFHVKICTTQGSSVSFSPESLTNGVVNHRAKTHPLTFSSPTHGINNQLGSHSPNLGYRPATVGIEDRQIYQPRLSRDVSQLNNLARLQSNGVLSHPHSRTLSPV